MTTETGKADFYNESYRQVNYFRYPTWMYGPYISSLIAFCGLKKGDSVLDVGCGQGFFSYLFSKHGLKVHGIDISETGIRTAEKLYGQFHVTFAVSDIQTATYAEQFDCVFVRSCSLYNSDAFPFQTAVTDTLLSHVRPGGTLIFVYNSNFSSKLNASWRYHSLDDVRRHFRGCPSAEIFFLNKVSTCLFRKYSINPLFTRLNALGSRFVGVGGDLLCIVRKSR